MSKSQQGFIESLAGKRKELFIVLKAYFDETGINDDAKACIVAGYFGGEGQWKRLEKSWLKILREHGVKEFHAKRFFGRDVCGKRLDEYREWSDKKAEQFINALISSVRDSKKIHPVSCAVVKSEWNKRAYGERKIMTGGLYRAGKFISSGAASKAYFLPFQFCILNAASHCGSGQKTHFIFDLNHQFRGYSEQLYALLKGNHPGLSPSIKERLGRISFEISEESAPLQIADLFNYLSAKYVLRRVENMNAAAGPKLGPMLANGVEKKDHLFFDKHGLDEAVKGLPIRIREFLKPIHKNQRKFDPL